MRYLVATAAFFIVCLPPLPAADRDSDDTPKAAATRKKLKQKIDVEFKDTPLREVVEELKDQIKGLQMQIDSKGGVSGNQAITYKGKDVTLEDALDQMFKKNGLGYIVISQKNNAYDGSVKIVQGKERGYPLKKD